MPIKFPGSLKGALSLYGILVKGSTYKELQKLVNFDEVLVVKYRYAEGKPFNVEIILNSRGYERTRECIDVSYYKMETKYIPKI